jgi:predicted adenylyl cyclase CyaB
MEIELKFRLSNVEKAVSTLNALGFKEANHKHQVDTYLICGLVKNEVKEYLRVRQDLLSNESSLDYHRVLSKLETEENEVKVSDSKSTIKIFVDLGYDVVCVVNKKRRSFVKQSFTAVIDKVETLGHFLEIEVTELSSNTEEEIENLATLLGVNVRTDLVDRKSYPELLAENNC